MHVLKNTGARVCEIPCMQVWGQTPTSMAFRGPGPPRSVFYLLVVAFAPAGFGSAGVFGTVAVDTGILTSYAWFILRFPIKIFFCPFGRPFAEGVFGMPWSSCAYPICQI
jgi:hypothetical protein